MKLEVTIISLPNIALNAFAAVIGQESVNEVDVQNVQPFNKFVEAAGELLSDKEDAWKHLYLTIGFKAPPLLFSELINFSDMQVVTESDNFLTSAILTVSFFNMRRLICFLTARNDLCETFAKILTNRLSQLSYFQESHKWNVLPA